MSIMITGNFKGSWAISIRLKRVQLKSSELNFYQKQNEMKKYFNISILIGIFFFGLTSCKKDETEPANEEGLKSSTGDLETPSPPEAEDAIVSHSEVVFHKSYGAELSEEEVDALWERDVKQFKKESAQSKVNGVSTEFFYSVRIWTGTQTNNGTTGEAYFDAIFITDMSSPPAGRTTLNMNGELTDLNGGDDRYLMKYVIDEGIYPISFVEAVSGRLSLKGTDGWFVKFWAISLFPDQQSVPATGFSQLGAKVNKWLDNDTPEGWDQLKIPGSDGVFDVRHYGQGLRF